MIRFVCWSAIGVPIHVMSIRLVKCFIFSALRTFSVLLIEFLLFLRLGPSALRITLFGRSGVVRVSWVEGLSTDCGLLLHAQECGVKPNIHVITSYQETIAWRQP